MNTGIPDSGATGFYYSQDALVTDFQNNGSTTVVGTATGQFHTSTTTARHQIPNLPDNFPRTDYVLPAFQDMLLGLGTICDADCTVLFDKRAVTICNKAGLLIISSWRDRHVPHL